MSDVGSLLRGKSPPEKKEGVIYARVSSSKQKEDLERQVAELKRAYPSYTVYSDIGSGLNYHRPKFDALLDRVYKGTVGEIVVAYRDRLCRYGFELVEKLCKQNNTKIVVHNQRECPETPTDELAQDLLAICNYFVAKNNGRRGGRRRTTKINQNQIGSVSGVESAIEKVDGDSKMDL
jgi:predicted site-specific integrase-resolvase